MKLHDIMIESLKLMFASYDRDLALASIDDLKADSAYRDYIYNMPPAINRAFGLIENKDVLRDVVRTYTASGEKLVIPEYIAPTDGMLGGSINRIGIKTSSGISWLSLGEVDFSGSEMVITSPSGQYVVHYSPKIKRVTAKTAEGTEIPIPDDIAALIPYYVKSELYREESLEEYFLSAEAYGELLAKIRALEPIYRDVILMKYLYGYANLEISAMLGISESTVRVRLMRGKKLLKNKISGGAGDG